MPTQRIVFPVGPDPFVVFVAFVSGDIDNGLHRAGLSRSLQYMDRAHDIRRIRLDRLPVRKTHERLRCHMDDNLRSRMANSITQGIERSYITKDGHHASADRCKFKQIGLGCGWQRKPRHLRAHHLQPN